MRKVLQEILEKNPRFHHLTPLKTKHIAHWCRCHGYTPPDPESLRNDGDSIEDVLTQIDSEPECPSSFSSADNLCRKLEDLQQFQKREPENEEEVDILSLSEPVKINIKKEQEEKQEEVKFYLPPTPGSEFIGDVTQKVGVVVLIVHAAEQTQSWTFRRSASQTQTQMFSLTDPDSDPHSSGGVNA